MAEAHVSTDHGQHHDVVVDHSHHPHVCSFQTFLAVYVALLFLTVVTVAVARVDLGAAAMPVAMAIAAVKASLVMTVFMHLKWDTAMNNIAFLSSLLFLSLLFLFTLADVFTRGEVDAVSGSPAPLPEPAEPRFYNIFEPGDH